MPKSRAMCANGFLLDWTSCTASTLNSLVNVRCVLCMIFSLPVSGSLLEVYLLHFSGSRPHHWTSPTFPWRRNRPILVFMGIMTTISLLFYLVLFFLTL